MIFAHARACEKSQALFFFHPFVKFSSSFMEVEGILEDDTMKARYAKKKNPRMFDTRCMIYGHEWSQMVEEIARML